jgi:cytochrome c-type biogenesis protein
MLEIGILASFGAGIVSFLSPCILPLVPPYLCFLAGASFDELMRGDAPGLRRRAVARALAFVLGFSAVFIALGASASVAGEFVAEHLTLLSRLAGAVIVLLGLHMAGVFRWSLLMRQARIEANMPATFGGAMLVGLAFGFGWTPCVGPVLASILLVAGAQDGAREGAVLLAAYAAGIGIPFLGAALFVGPFTRWMARFRRHMDHVEKAMGLALIATGITIFFGWMPEIGAWLLDHVPLLGRIG